MNRIGKLIALEGIDGSGKTTLAHALGESLERAGHRVLVTKQPGGTEFGKRVRALIDETGGAIYPRAQYLLFAADRVEHIERIIKPALAAGTLVICDRLTDSSIAYQCYGYGVDRAQVESINDWTMGGIVADCTLYLRIDPTLAAARIAARGLAKTPFEKEGGAYTSRVIAGFEEQCARNARCRVLDGAAAPDELLKAAYAAVCHLL
jgi:dTMP kinase